ncbi:MAG TPA: hypothetical protein VGN26_11315 [Armatimonadota bacterium]|jgi:hypothetical protein
MAIAEKSGQEVVAEAARRRVADLCYEFLLKQTEPIRMGDIVTAVTKHIGVSAKVVRFALMDHTRFLMVGREWDLVARDLDPRRAIERLIADVIRAYGHPMDLATIGRELSHSLNRGPHALMDVSERMVRSRPEFFRYEGAKVGLTEWLLELKGDTPEDILWENFEDESEVDALKALASGIDWSAGAEAASLAIMDKAERPIGSRALQFVVWSHLRDDFNPEALFKTLYTRKDTAFLSGGLWCGPAMVSQFSQALQAVDKQEIGVELSEEDLPKPISIEAADLETVKDLLSGGPSRVVDILETHFEIPRDDPGYNQNRESLEKALRGDSRFEWAGWDRWQLVQQPPAKALQFPELLQPIFLDVETSQGQLVDQELEDEGLDGDLAAEIQKPLAALQGDLQPEDGGARAILTWWHREAGTLPSPAVSKAMPALPEFIRLDATDAKGKHFELWLNNQMQLIFGLGEFYKSAALPHSGAIFHLVAKGGPGTYTLEYKGEKDKQTFIEPSRVKDLLAIRERSMTQEMSTWEVLKDVMSAYSKGVKFPELYAEVIVVRNSTARLIASLLSSYYGFYEKGGNWHFNERDADKGFKKPKRKYIIKR